MHFYNIYKKWIRLIQKKRVKANPNTKNHLIAMFASYADAKGTMGLLHPATQAIK